jgi:RND family efflux transporter MFP subunit
MHLASIIWRATLIGSLLPLLLTAAQANDEPLVTIQRFAELAKPRDLEFPASAVALRQVEVAAETSGRITRFSLQPGDTVRQGQALLRIDCSRAEIEQTRAEAGLKRLQASRDLTEQQLQRARTLVQSRSISRDELDQRETQLNADIASIEEQQALLKLAALAVEDCILRAPFSGVVVDKLNHAGGFASPGKPMLILLQTDSVEIHLELPSEYVDDLEQQPDIQFFDGQQRYDLRLRRVLPATNPVSLMRQAKLTVTDTIKPTIGSRGVVQFKSRDLFLPAAVIVQRDARFGVLTADNDRASFVELIGAREGIKAMAQMPADTLIITPPLNGLADQTPIRLR